MIYELNYLVGESKEADLEKIKKEVEEIVAGEGAKLLEPIFTEKRKLAYKVEKDIRGTYTARRFELPEKDSEEAEKNAEKENPIKQITKKLNLNQNILRFIIVKADELPELGKKEERIAPKKEIKVEKVLKEKKPVEEVPVASDNIDEKLDELLNI
jgi:ribosomal protein S6